MVVILIEVTLVVHSTVMFGQFNTEDYGGDEEEQTIADREPETILQRQTNRKYDLLEAGFTLRQRNVKTQLFPWLGLPSIIIRYENQVIHVNQIEIVIKCKLKCQTISAPFQITSCPISFPRSFSSKSTCATITICSDYYLFRIYLALFTLNFLMCIGIVIQRGNKAI